MRGSSREWKILQQHPVGLILVEIMQIKIFNLFSTHGNVFNLHEKQNFSFYVGVEKNQRKK